MGSVSKPSALKDALADTGFVGVGNVVKGSHLPGYRSIWASIIVAAVVINGVHVGLTIKRYCEREVSTSTSQKLNESVIFPSVLFLLSMRGDGAPLFNYSMNLTRCTFRDEICDLERNFTVLEHNDISRKLGGRRTGNFYGFYMRNTGDKVPNTTELIPPAKAGLVVAFQFRRNNGYAPSTRELARNGLQLRMAVAPPDLDTPGMDVWFLPLTQWHTVPHNFAVRMILQVKSSKRLPPPFNNCALDYPERLKRVLTEEFYGASSLYNLEHCQRYCPPAVEAELCGCLSNHTIARYGRYPQYDLDKFAACASDACAKENNNDTQLATEACKSACLPACEELEFGMMESYAFAYFPDSRDTISFQIILEYPSSGLITSVEENEAYPLTELLNDVGSQINFYLGLSVAVMAEAAVLLVAAVSDRNAAEKRKLSRRLYSVFGRKFTQRVLVADIVEEIRRTGLRMPADSNGGSADG